MEASEVSTIEQILREYDIDGLLETGDFEALLDELRNRENIMITDSRKD